MFKDRAYHLTMVEIDIRCFNTIRQILPKLLYPENFSFKSVIVPEKSKF